MSASPIIRGSPKKKSTLWTRPKEEPELSEQDIDNIEEEPPSYSSPPAYDANEVGANEVEPINLSIEKMPDISYNPDEDLSYRE
jgi:hypothetical protein